MYGLRSNIGLMLQDSKIGKPLLSGGVYKCGEGSMKGCNKLIREPKLIPYSCFYVVVLLHFFFICRLPDYSSGSCHPQAT